MPSQAETDIRRDILKELDLSSDWNPARRHDGQVILARLPESDGHPMQVSKRYDGALRALRIPERDALMAVGDCDLQRTIRLSSFSRSQRGDEMQAEYKGPDLGRWETLCWGSERNPFAEVRNCLIIVREILTALHEFHQAGFVHCDVKLDNFCMPPVERRPREEAGVYFGHMNPAKLCIIDLGYALGPARGRRELWRYEPAPGHSEGAPLHPVDGEFPYLSPRFLQAVSEAVAGRPERFRELDWRIDLFSLGRHLDSLNAEIRPRGSEALLDYWQRLPASLMAWDRDGEAPALPHFTYIREIGELVGPVVRDIPYEVELDRPMPAAPYLQTLSALATGRSPVAAVPASVIQALLKEVFAEPEVDSEPKSALPAAPPESVPVPVPLMVQPPATLPTPMPPAAPVPPSLAESAVPPASAPASSSASRPPAQPRFRRRAIFLALCASVLGLLWLLGDDDDTGSTRNGKPLKEKAAASPAHSKKTDAPPAHSDLPPVSNIHGWSASRVQALQRQTAAALGMKVADRLCPDCPEEVVIPPGIFRMGAEPGESGEQADRQGSEAPHQVTIASPLAVGRSEVTFAEWDACVADGACRFAPEDTWGRGRQPVMNVSWQHIEAQFLPWLNRKAGLDRKPRSAQYRLLTEAEWEFVARGGTTGPFGFEGAITADKVNYDSRHSYRGSSRAPYLGRTVEAGSLPANPWGLTEIHGNLWEWVHDCWHENYDHAPSDGRAWGQENGGDCSARVLRGGGWDSYPDSTRSANRGWDRSGNRSPDIGFRVARSLKP